MVPSHPGRVTGPARAGSKAVPVSAPHEEAEDQGQADRDWREGGRGGRRPRCSPTWPAWSYRRHGCADPLDARGVRLTPSRAIKKGRRYRYYVSAALITEAGTDRAQGRRIVSRVLGPRPERLSIGGAGLSRPPHSTEDSSIKHWEIWASECVRALRA
jgi:hypothetical protein